MVVTQSSEETRTRESASFRERLSQLEAVIPKAAIDVQPLLSHIHRSALRLHDQLQRIDCTPPLPRTIVSQVHCFDCESTKMESFHTSTQGGYHLCPACFQQRLRTGRAKAAH
jgi:formylmethanofuran dehydrogenase subunit E